MFEKFQKKSTPEAESTLGAAKRRATEQLEKNDIFTIDFEKFGEDLAALLPGDKSEILEQAKEVFLNASIQELSASFIQEIQEKFQISPECMSSDAVMGPIKERLLVLLDSSSIDDAKELLEKIVRKFGNEDDIKRFTRSEKFQDALRIAVKKLLLEDSASINKSNFEEFMEPFGGMYSQEGGKSDVERYVSYGIMRDVIKSGDVKGFWSIVDRFTINPQILDMARESPDFRTAMEADISREVVESSLNLDQVYDHTQRLEKERFLSKPDIKNSVLMGLSTYFSANINTELSSEQTEQLDKLFFVSPEEIKFMAIEAMKIIMNADPVATEGLVSLKKNFKIGDDLNQLLSSAARNALTKIEASIHKLEENNESTSDEYAELYDIKNVLNID